MDRKSQLFDSVLVNLPLLFWIMIVRLFAIQSSSPKSHFGTVAAVVEKRY